MWNPIRACQQPHAQIQGSFEQQLAAVATTAGEHLGGRVVVTALDTSSCPSPLATLHSVHSTPGDVEFVVLPEGTALHVHASHDAAAVLQGYLMAPDAPLPEGVRRHAIFEEGATTLLLVCVHKLRDKRCGVVGPMLVETFRYGLRFVWRVIAQKRALRTCDFHHTAPGLHYWSVPWRAAKCLCMVSVIQGATNLPVGGGQGFSVAMCVFLVSVYLEF